MSSLEKSIQLLNSLPDSDVEKVYSYIQFICSQHTNNKTPDTNESIEDILNSITGSIPDNGKTLEEYKIERIHERYEVTN